MFKNLNNVLSVTQLNNQVTNFLENNFASVCVEGEVSSLKQYRSGYIYFTLKDNDSEISTVVFLNTAKELLFNIETASILLASSISFG